MKEVLYYTKVDQHLLHLRNSGMPTIIHNTTIFCNSKNSTILYDAALAIEGSRIVKIGLFEKLKRDFPQANMINGQGKLLMPGFINTHMHLYSTFARGLALEKSPQNFIEILNDLWWRLDKALDHESIYYSAIVPAITAVRNGVTSIIDHHASPNAIDGSLDQIEAALDKVGLRANLCYEVSDRDGKEKSIAGLRENERYSKRCMKKKRTNSDHAFDSMIGLHASFTLEDDTLETASELGNELGKGFHLHLAEGPEDDARQQYRISTTERLEKVAILGSKTIAAHAIHIDDRDKAILSQTGTMVVHNPQSNMNNAVGTSDVFDMIKKNIIVGLGTDGMSASLFPDIRAANLVHKLVREDSQIGWNEIQKIVLENNSEIFERVSGARVGQIEEGLPADMILVDYYPPTPLTVENIWGHILFGTADAQVDTVWINGKIILKDKGFIAIDEAELNYKANECATKLWSRF